ncbi:D-alanyl-D-alanine carboxypeptidase family protein [uncultured Aquabacterium sp.]|uniref:D-alanyl-D-alanine carboxypeptidase family protein n=1 Tax=Aquabacterium sp. TaxID=1872578 RepID=UPI0025EA837B|nr:D-alanyl-D-alanine carboxypeptidase family protein [uncultured Aquabacterium sp.]
MIFRSSSRRVHAALLLVAMWATTPLTAVGQTLVPPPAIEAKAYLLMDYESGQVLMANNADQPLPPASLTKMMTSYIVEQALKSGRIKQGDMVSVSQNAWCRGSSTESCMYLPLNGQASVMDMLRGIIIQSGNDASKAMAEHLAGTEAAFAQLMNKEAKRLGMNHSQFANATGLPAPNHQASARDLAILARAIIRDSADYYSIYAEKEFKYNGIKQGNRNALLYTDPTVDGLKTGHTNDAGFCLVASSRRNGMRLISVVMGSSSMQSRADQTRAMFNWGFSSFESASLLKAQAPAGVGNVKFGVVDQVRAGVPKDWTVLVPRGQAAQVRTAVQLQPDLVAPIAKGAVIGKVVATVDGKPLAEQNVVALDAVERAGFFKRTWQQLQGLFH